jgi:hypothetical protein
MLNLSIYIIFIFFFSGYGLYLHYKFTEKLISTYSEQILILQSQVLLLESEKNKLIESTIQNSVEPLPDVLGSNYVTQVLLVGFALIVVLSYYYSAGNQSALITEQNTPIVEAVANGNKALLDYSGDLLEFLKDENVETLRALARVQFRLDYVLQEQIRLQALMESLVNKSSIPVVPINLDSVIMNGDGGEALTAIQSILEGGGI